MVSGVVSLISAALASLLAMAERKLALAWAAAAFVAARLASAPAKAFCARVNSSPDTEPEATGWVDLDQYPTVYAGLDAAIVPLQPNRFNEAKSWLKGLEAAALGVPFVASPTGPYQQLHDLGAGLLAVTPDDWNRHITNLMGSPQMRADIAGQGLAVAADWTIERRVDAWVDAWHHARTLHARRHRELRIA